MKDPELIKKYCYCIKLLAEEMKKEEPTIYESW